MTRAILLNALAFIHQVKTAIDNNHSFAYLCLQLLGGNKRCVHSLGSVDGRSFDLVIYVTNKEAYSRKEIVIFCIE